MPCSEDIMLPSVRRRTTMHDHIVGELKRTPGYSAPYSGRWPPRTQGMRKVTTLPVGRYRCQRCNVARQVPATTPIRGLRRGAPELT
jgi:hypothetical protein